MSTYYGLELTDNQWLYFWFFILFEFPIIGGIITALIIWEWQIALGLIVLGFGIPIGIALQDVLSQSADVRKSLFKNKQTEFQTPAIISILDAILNGLANILISICDSFFGVKKE